MYPHSVTIRMRFLDYVASVKQQGSIFIASLYWEGSSEPLGSFKETKNASTVACNTGC